MAPLQYRTVDSPVGPLTLAGQRPAPDASADGRPDLRAEPGRVGG